MIRPAIAGSRALAATPGQESEDQARFLQTEIWQDAIDMSLVKLLGFTTLGCGCVLGRYREVGTNREVTYVEEKGTSCLHRNHLRNQPLSADRVAHGFRAAHAVRAS